MKHRRATRSTDTHEATHRRGFTVVELLVVIGILVLLIALLFPAYSRVRAAARTTKCLTNQRQLTQANTAYATDNKGKYVSPRTDTFGQAYPGNTNTVQHPWVMAQGANVTGTYELPSALEQGKLWNYTGTAALYLSPEEPTNPHGVASSNSDTRIRSYSFNALVGVSRPDEWSATDSMFTGAGYPVFAKFNTTSIGRIPQPSRTMSTIVEDDAKNNYNHQGWIVQPEASVWIDWPAAWRPDAITMSFVDGSTETYSLKNPDLVELWTTDPDGHDITQGADAVAGYAVDWKYFRDRMLPGVIPNCTTFNGD